MTVFTKANPPISPYPGVLPQNPLLVSSFINTFSVESSGALLLAHSILLPSPQLYQAPEI